MTPEDTGHVVAIVVRYLTAFAALVSSSTIANILGVAMLVAFVVYDFKLWRN